MLEPLILGGAIGLFSAAVPGPFSALVAAAALREGFGGGVRIAVVPLLSEVIVLGLTTLLVSSLPDGLLRWIGGLGAFFLFYLATRTWKEARSTGQGRPAEVPKARSTIEAAVLAILSPAPWVFWLLVGSPIFLSSLREGWVPAVLFAGSFLASLIGVNIGIAGLASRGHDTLSPKLHKRLLVGATGVLVIAGGVLTYYTWTGDFSRMVTGSRDLKEMVDSITPR